MEEREYRIVWVSPHCWPDYVLRPNGLGVKSQGGQTVVMYQATKALTQVNPGMFVDIYGRYENDEEIEKKIHYHVDMIRQPLGDPSVYVPKEAFWGSPIAEFVEHVYKYAEEHGLKYDLLHGHYADGWYVAHHLALKWNIPFVLSTHSLGIRKRENALRSEGLTATELDRKYNFPARIQMETAALHAADMIMPLTEEEGRYIVEKYDVPVDKIHVVNNGVLYDEFYPIDHGQVKALKEELGIEENDLVVLLVARVDERKGQKQLIEAAPGVIEKVKQASGRNVKFCMVSWVDTPYAKKLEKRIDELGVRDNMILYPPVKHSNIPKFFWLADVYALTSTYDIFPIVMLEAMLCRTAPVATKNGGPSEVLENGVDGMLVDTGNIPEVVDAFVKILGDDKRLKEMGEAAHKKVMEKYTWRKIAQRFDMLYRQAMDKRKSKVNA